MRLELRFSVSGRGRFLSHLESVDMMLAAFRRAGFQVALSKGMRPKPVISLALARAVGVSASDEILTVELAGEHEPDDVRTRLAETVPRGFGIHAAALSRGTPKVTAARYRVELDAPQAVIERAASLYAAVGEAPVERRSPKGVKTVDVKAYAPIVEVSEGGFEVEVAVSVAGSARPEEVARALEQCAGVDLPVTGVTRLELRLADDVVVAGAHGETA